MSELDHWLENRSFEDWKTQFDKDGYVIFERVLDTEKVQEVRNALKPHLTYRGRNDFEGLNSNRVYALLAKHKVFAELSEHPLSLAFAESELGKSCLLSACLAINLLPGESVQPWHSDDNHIDVPSPHPPFGVSTFWTLDDTTEENGATEIIPGSHTWDESETSKLAAPKAYYTSEWTDNDNDPCPRDDKILATMPAGSLMISKGSLWHRGGANRSDSPRLIVTPQYCVGWARPLETMLKAVPPEVVATYSERVQELLGYSIHAPFMGYVDGVHPKRSLNTMSAAA